MYFLRIQNQIKSKGDNRREKKEKREMDRVFSSMEEMSGHLWSSSSAVATAAAPANENEEEEEQSKMNRSASEWAFQRFLQEASVSPSSSSPQNDVEEIKVNAAYPNGPNPTRTNNNSSSSSNTASFNLQLQPPNVPIDSEEYQAFLKTKLDLACAAVALSRVKVRSFLSGPLEICSNSNGMV